MLAGVFFKTFAVAARRGLSAMLRTTHAVRWLRGLNPAVIVAICGVSVSTAGFVATRRYWDDPSASQQLELLAEHRRLSVQAELHDFEQVVDTASELLVPPVAPASRDAFLNSIDVLRRRFVGVGAVAWAPRVLRAERAAHEAAAVQEHLEDYRITDLGVYGGSVPASDRAEYLPLLYISGEQNATLQAGVDLRSEPVIRNAIDRALDAGAPAASGRFRFATASGMKSAIALLQPVYALGLARSTAEERREAMVGFVVGLVDPGVLIEKALGAVKAKQGLDIYLFEHSAGLNDLPFHFHPSPLRSEPERPRPLGELGANRHWTGQLSLADARWTMVVTPIPGAPFLAQVSRAWIVLLAGLGLSAAVTMYSWFLSQSLAQIRHERDKNSLSNLLLKTAMEAATNGMLIVDVDRRVLATNQRFLELFQVPESLRQALKTEKDDRPLLQFMTSSMENPDEFLARVQYLYEHPEEVAHEDIGLADGRIFDRHSAPLYLESKAYLGRIWFFRDVTEARRSKAHLTEMASVDGLTGLANRNTFMERLAGEFAAARQSGRGFAVLFVDVDYFKEVNDTRGHAAGDAVLIEIGKRLRSAVRQTDMVARFGGDEFAVLVSGAADAESAACVAEKARSMLAGERASGTTVTVSIGISLYSPDSTTPAELLELADQALYRAKQLGRNRHCLISA